LITNVMFLHEKTSKTASPCSIGGMKKHKKSPKKLASSTKLTRTSKSKTSIKEDTGKFRQRVGGLEAAKLIFGSIYLGGVLRGELPNAMLIIGGSVMAFVLGVIGLNLAKKKERRGRPANKPDARFRRKKGVGNKRR